MADEGAQTEVDDETSVLPSAVESSSQKQSVPHFRRDVKPRNIALSADDLRAFTDLIIEVNQQAKKLELERVDPTEFKDEQDAARQLDEFMPVEYRFEDINGDSVKAVGALEVPKSKLPYDLRSFFISNAAFTQRAYDRVPLNAVDAFIDFKRPSLGPVDKLDSQSVRDVIEDSFCGGYLGAVADGGCRVGIL